MRTIFLICTLSLLCAARLHAQPANSDPPASMEELKKLYDDKQWQPLLAKLSRVTAMRGKAAEVYDRFELFMMKGEAHLQLKQNSAASSAFEEASKVEGAGKVKIATADTSALVVKRSQNGQYKRKSPSSQPTDEKTLDVMDVTKRKSVFAAIAADEAAAVGSKAKAATSGNSLRPIADILKSLTDLKNAEIAATESETTPVTDGIVTPLAKHANDLSARELANMKTKVDTIEQSANTIQEVGGNRNRAGKGGTGNGGAGGGYPRPIETRYKRRGLLGTDMQALRDVIATCGNIYKADTELAQAFATPGLAQPLEATAKDSESLARRAKALLDTDYNITTSDPRGFK